MPVTLSELKYRGFGIGARLDLRSSFPILPGTRKSELIGRTSTRVDCGLGGGDIGTGRSCLGVTGSLVVLAGGVVGRSILGICV